jgi:hypothetical protein
MLTYSQRKTFAKHGAQAIEATIDAARQSVLAEQRANQERLIAEYRARNAPVPFTRSELDAATHIRTSVGWHKVVRVNAKSVTVETGYSWTDRYALDKILEVRAVSS